MEFCLHSWKNPDDVDTNFSENVICGQVVLMTVVRPEGMATLELLL